MAESNWWNEVGSHCSGEAAFLTSVSPILPNTIRTTKIGQTQSYAAILTPDESTAIQKQQDHTLNRHVLNAKEANTLVKKFEELGDQKVPAFFKAGANLIAGLAIPKKIFEVAAGWLLDWVFGLADTKAVVARDISLLIAEGGALRQTAQVLKGPVGRLLFSTVLYEVDVGSEKRTIVLYACIFPIAVKVSRFETESPANNKVVQPINDKTWGIFDLESNSWDEKDFRPSHQDGEYMYFLQDEYENNNVAGQAVHRLSLWGGDWQRKHYDSEKFAPIYLSMKCA
ncbi:hypothetical protein [Sphingomonas arenae]|uniref:hypothetical protein n=1 Tax=Sphingomonas arenae TaxID=2812555 RepID=UPI001966E2FC|nr:hypothetical protein [Sphingomonas arenae]